MQREKRNINFRLFSNSSENSTLHSIPKLRMNKVNHKVINLLPAFSLSVLLLLGLTLFNPHIAFSNNAYAAENIETKGDSTASITLDTSNIQVNAAPGTTAYATKNITINANNVESYTLTITAPKQLSNEKAGTYNDWSYTYGNQEDLDTTEKLEAVEGYKAFTGSAQELESGTNATITNSVKALVFSTYFDDNAVSGHYTADVLLSLTSTPNSVAKDLSGITYMQEMTPEICENTPFMSEDVTYSKEYILTDKRTYPKDANGNNVSNTYTVRKIGDQCWMTQNLRIYDTTIKAMDSDFAGEDITLPNSTRSNFTGDDASQYSYQSYYNTDQATGAGINTTSYYNWYAATAGAGSATVMVDNQSVNTSICPRGWTLPTGGTTSVAATESTWSDYYRLFRNMDLGISTNSLSTTSNTSWSSKNDISDLAMVQTGKDADNRVIYNLLYTGYVYAGSFRDGISDGYWWSNMALNVASAYYLNINSSNVYPGTYSSARYSGFAVRCVARGSAEWRMSDATVAGYSTATNFKNSGISTMQEMTAEVCDQVPTPASTATTVPTLRLRDTRDNNDYIIAKYPDGRCWMAENLRIYNTTIKAADSDFEGEDIVLPDSAESSFTSSIASKYSYRSYYNTKRITDAGINTTTYYNWYTATAGAGNSSVKTDNQDVSTSICPKGWTLPSGGTGTATEFKDFTSSGSIASDGFTKIMNTPYNFTLTGYVDDGSLENGTSNGRWWSSTTYNADLAYALSVSNSYVSPGTDHNTPRYNGFPIRCIARN